MPQMCDGCFDKCFRHKMRQVAVNRQRQPATVSSYPAHTRLGW
jgi:hypothetical protein